VRTLFVEKEITYTGEQLSSLWAYSTFNVQGDSIVAFVGPCDVNLARMVDQADVKEGAAIRSESMLHFIAEHFDLDLEKGILRQRLLVCIACEVVNEMLGRGQVARRGDDLYDAERKLSVSIATLSPVSSLIHLGLNISSRNTPVPAVGLSDYGLDPRHVGEAVLERYAEEVERIHAARSKVRGVE